MPSKGKTKSFGGCARLADAFKDRGSSNLEVRDELSLEPVHTVYCANVVCLGFLINIFISFFAPFWILNARFIKANFLPWKQSVLVGYDGLCFGLAVVGASIHTGHPKVRIIKLMYIAGDGMEDFMPCLFWLGLARHVILRLKYVPAQAGNT